MSYQVTLNSRNVLVPISLEGRDGKRLNTPPSRLDAATAMAVSVTTGGGFSQEFIPLRIVADPTQAYAGAEWELRAHKAGREWFVFYLGVPDRCFVSAGADPSSELKSLSIQVVGSSPMTGREEFTGGVDVTLQAQVPVPLVPGFLGLGERFFPTLLPHNFVEGYALDIFTHGGRRDLLLMASLQTDPSDRVPVSFGKHWEPKNWVGAAVENLAEPGAAVTGYHVVRGGCFYGRNRRVTHWFGGSIGLEERTFRQAASEKIKSMGPSGNGAWVFWLEPQGQDAPDAEALKGMETRHPQARFSIRHAMLHRLLSHPPSGAGAGTGKGASEAASAYSALAASPASPAIAHLPAEAAVSALASVARILANHQAELYRARTEPSHAKWSEQAGKPKGVAAAVADALVAAEGGAAPAGPEARKAARPPSLESAIQDLYRSQGEALRALESFFDETSGYAAWDSVTNPLRDILSAYLAQGAEAGATA